MLRRAVAIFAFVSLFAVSLAAQPARAVTVELFAVDFQSSPGGAPVAGSVSGRFSANDANIDGVISASEILSFSFTSDFADPALDFAGDESSFSLFALVPPAAPAPLTAGLSWEGFGLIGFGAGVPFGDTALLILAPAQTIAARLGPDPAVALAGAPTITVVPLSGTLPTMLLALGLLGFFAWRGQPPLPRRRARSG